MSSGTTIQKSNRTFLQWWDKSTPVISDSTKKMMAQNKNYFVYEDVNETDELLVDVEHHQKGYQNRLSHESTKQGHSLLWRRMILTFYLLLFPLLAFAMGWLVIDRFEDAIYSRYSSSSSSTISDSDTFVMDIGNDYGSVMRKSNFGVDYPWSIIIEPYKVTYFSIEKQSTAKQSSSTKRTNKQSTNADRKTSSKTGSSDGELQYRWLWDGATELGTGANISANIPGPAGTSHNVTVQVWSITANKKTLLQELQETVVLKYKRREVREMLAQDRVAMFQAMSVMQRVPTAVGQRLYGNKYYSKDYFNRIHLYFGASRDCDRMHEGPGFISAHMAMTLMFEQALQAVNPSVSLPYWDFTLESTFLSAETFRSSVIFSDGWFSEGDTVSSNPGQGNIPSSSMDHVVRLGRFGLSPVMQRAENFSLFVNAFGLLRAPWNANPYPYLTRATTSYDVQSTLKPSGCAEYSATVNKGNFISAAMALNTDAHGHIHELIGGSWGFRQSLPLQEADTETHRDTVFHFSHYAEKYSKILWRSGHMTCPTPVDNATVRDTCVPVSDVSRTVVRTNTNAAEEDSPEVCRCQCVGVIATKHDEDLAKAMFNLGLLTDLVWFDDAIKVRSITNFLNTQKSGPALPIDGYSMKESLSIYRTIRDYICDMGMIGDMFQGTSTQDMLFWVLHPNMERLWHAQRLATSYGLLPFDENWAETDRVWTCLGHKSTDATFVKNVFDAKNVVNTNLELYAYVHPARLELPYIYEQMTFPHCEALGYNMKGF